MGRLINPNDIVTANGSGAALLCVRADTPADLAEYTAWAGRAPDLVHAFGDAGSWTAVVAKVKATIALFPGVKLAWAMPLATGTQGNPPTQVETPAQLAAGNFDVHINYCLDMILAHNPSGPVFLRPGWEPGILTAFPWGATTSIASAKADYIAAFQKFVTLARAKSDRFVISLCVSNVNVNSSNTVVDPFDATTGFDPGVAYYDAIGIDAYLIGTDVSNGQTFNRLSYTTGSPALLFDDVAYGFRRLAKFAQDNNKAITIDEWGVGADRPDYIKAMKAFIANPRNRVLYHGYWNKNGGTQANGQYPFACRLSDNSNAYPKAKAAFLEAFYGAAATTVEQTLTSAYLARSTAVVTDATRALVDQLCKDLVVGGLVPYLDGLSILCNDVVAGDNTLLLLNLLGGGGFTTSAPRSAGRFAINGSPTIVANRGITGDGTTAAFLRGTSLNMLSAQNRKGTQNDAHMGAMFLTAVSNVGAQSYECGVASSFIGRNAGGTQWVGKPNSGSTLAICNTGQDAGHVMWNRSSSTDYAGFFNGVATGKNQTVTASTSVAQTNDDLRIAGIPGLGGGANQIAFVHWGKALPTTPFDGPLTLYNALRAFATGVGVP